MKVNRTPKPAVLLAGCLLALLVVVVGCRSAPGGGGRGDEAPVGKGSAQHWVENCSRCHNIRYPLSYSDAEWDVATMHMRWRAMLTPEQHHAIRKLMMSMN